MEARASTIYGAETLDGLRVAEDREGATLRLRSWEALDPDLVCGITTAAAGNFGVFGTPADALHDSFVGLAEALGFRQIAVPLLVHGRDIAEVVGPPEGSRPVSLSLSGRIDGQVTASRGCLLAATAADCVPAYLWDAESGGLGLVHAGWRGVAAGILGEALRRLPGAGRNSPTIRLHLGPAICGSCYEVDRPVLAALGFGGERAQVDLRGLLVRQALESGLRRESVSVSTHCTRCGAEGLHSHRGSGGTAGRMAAFLGLRRSPGRDSDSVAGS